ncbi:hypothetical protein AB0F71_18295 [Kitasatospora sp. NPDC028055]|uniref:hypothetical protein n=1 Tax=Kitasatospora sp. NPDC028055 TaxID=3155653 RepID=UPI0033FFA4FC
MTNTNRPDPDPAVPRLELTPSSSPARTTAWTGTSPTTRSTGCSAPSAAGSAAGRPG